jgi:hypothetical protein
MTTAEIGSNYPSHAVQAAIAARFPTAHQIEVLWDAAPADDPEDDRIYPHSISRDLSTRAEEAFDTAHINLILRRAGQAASGDTELLDIIVDGLAPIANYDNEDDEHLPVRTLEALVRREWPTSIMVRCPDLLQTKLVAAGHQEVLVEAVLGAYPFTQVEVAVIHHHLRRAREGRLRSLTWLLWHYKQPDQSPSLEECSSSTHELLELAWTYISRQSLRPS